MSTMHPNSFAPVGPVPVNGWAAPPMASPYAGVLPIQPSNFAPPMLYAAGPPQTGALPAHPHQPINPQPPQQITPAPTPPGRPRAGAWEVATIVGSKFLDLRCLMRIPGIKPVLENVVDDVIALAAIWVDLDGYLRVRAFHPELDPLNFRACWFLGQEHRSRWEAAFKPVRLSSPCPRML